MDCSTSETCLARETQARQLTATGLRLAVVDLHSVMALEIHLTRATETHPATALLTHPVMAPRS